LPAMWFFLLFVFVFCLFLVFLDNGLRVAENE
jgi:hypothetical protein